MSTERPGVYTITHLPTGRRYVGSTKNLSKRWSAHRRKLRDGTHGNPLLQTAWTSDGPEAFRFAIVAFVEPSMLVVSEQRAIDLWRTVDEGFNRGRIAGAPYGGSGWPRTAETRDRMAAAQRAIHPPAGIGSVCGQCGTVRDGSYTQNRKGTTGRVTVKVNCQECARRRSRERQRRLRGVPLDHPPRVHYRRRGGPPDGDRHVADFGGHP